MNYFDFYGNPLPPMTPTYDQGYTGSPNNLGPQHRAVYTPVQNPYIQPQRLPISGRMVASLNDITPNEVPMDGSMSFFPQNDFSCVYGKCWNTDGTIKTIKYVPVLENQNGSEEPSPMLNTIEERLDRIEKLLSKQVKNFNNPKKELNTNE